MKKYNIVYNYFIDKIYTINREKMVNISERIREICKERKIPHWKLAEKAGITVTSLSRILNNSNFPSAKTLSAICRALEITEKELFAGFSTYKLSAQEFILLKYFRQLPDFKKIALLQFLSSEENSPHK